jgi:hypothetical protein
MAESAKKMLRNPMAGEIERMADDIFRDKVLRARKTPPDKRIELGPQLFDGAVRNTLNGIRNQHPNADEAEVRRILSKRMAIKRRLDEDGIYIDVEESS